MSRSAMLAGATGMVGQFLLRRLTMSPHYSRVIAIGRREPESGTRAEWLRTDYGNLAALGDKLAVDDVYCCLGTTTAKSGYDGLEAIDYGMVLELARATRAQGAKRFMVISALGASTVSPSHYSRIKGRMEADVAKLGFEAVHFFRPSLLVGARTEKRFWEDFFLKSVMPVVNPLLVGPLKSLHPVGADAVARAMLEAAFKPLQGRHVHHLP